MRARNNLHGISLLGPKALKCVPGFSLSRMHILQDADANAGLTQSKFRVAVDASHALAALSKSGQCLFLSSLDGILGEGQWKQCCIPGKNRT